VSSDTKLTHAREHGSSSNSSRAGVTALAGIGGQSWAAEQGRVRNPGFETDVAISAATLAVGPAGRTAGGQGC